MGQINDIKELDGEPEDLKPSSSRRSSISLLLGAGFSAPMGYPIGGGMNKKMLHLDSEPIDFGPNGRLGQSQNGEKPELSHDGVLQEHQKYFKFCKELIKEYASAHDGNFDYEKFYDFIYTNEAKDQRYQKLLEPLKAESESYDVYLGSLPSIYNQLVARFLKDWKGNSWYTNESKVKCSLCIYGSFLDYLSELSKSADINVHTLNNDLLFDSFNNYGPLKGKISDGFSEMGSDFYGELSIDDGSYNCRLERYIGQYDTSVRLYKLHGSLDFVPTYKKVDAVLGVKDSCVKTRFGMKTGIVLKDIGGQEYDMSWPQQYADFITGSTVKILKYKEPFYNNQLCHFQENLKQADKLIIIGYGFKDDGINNIIMRSFDYEHKHVYIVDNHAPKDGPVAKFAKKLNAHWLKVEIKDINDETFGGN